MNKLIVTVLGHDRPGIIAAVSKALYEQNCNIENVSQTILQTEFSGLFLIAKPSRVPVSRLDRALTDALKPMGLKALITPMQPPEPSESVSASEPFIITTKGPDRKGLVAAITEILARYGVNVTNMQAVFKGGTDPEQNRMIYEIDVPGSVDQTAMVADLRNKADELNLSISIQHRRIFEVLNRI